MKFRLVTPNSEPIGFPDEYETSNAPELQSGVAHLISRGHEYVRVIEWPPHECIKWFNKYGKPHTMLDDWAEWVNWAWHEGLTSSHAYAAYKKCGFSYDWLISSEKFKNL